MDRLVRNPPNKLNIKKYANMLTLYDLAYYL